MKKIKLLLMAAVAAFALSACSDDENTINENIISEYKLNDDAVAAQKAKSHHDKAILLVAFGSTWNNSFLAFDATKAAYEKAFPEYDVYVSFSSDICINRASVGENEDEEGNIVKRDYYEPRYLLHALGAAQYSEIRVQSLQVIPGEEFANVVACVKKFMNNGYVASAHLDDEYLSQVDVRLGMPLLNDPETDVKEVARQLDALYHEEAAQGVVAFMGHGNPDTYDTFKANIRYTQLEEALQAYSKNYYVGTVDMPDNYKQDVLARMQANGITGGRISLHALMSIAGDHAHNDMAGQGEEYWDEDEAESEENSWYEFFNHSGYQAVVPVTNNHPLGLLELGGVLNVWMQHTQDAETLEDAYHSMYPEE